MIETLLAPLEVVSVIKSGSLARETTVGPVHDFDLIVILTPGEGLRPSSEPGSAAAALTTLAGRLQGRAGVSKAEPRGQVRDGRPSVYLPFFDGVLRTAPPVDVMPAFRAGPDLLCPPDLEVPERRSDRWVTVNPGLLIELVEERQREWQYFKPAIGMVKYWAGRQGLDVPSAVLEALVLRFMPRPGPFETWSSDAERGP